MKLNQALLYFRTLQRLKPQQVTAQLRQKTRGFRPAPAFDGAPAFPRWKRRLQRPLLAARGADFNPAAEIRQGRWCFLNEQRTASAQDKWAVGEASKLWRYNLHYHEWLWSLEPADAASMVEDWIARHPADVSTDAWEPYVISLRLQNWVGYFAERGFPALENQSFRERWWRSLWQQAECLRRNLEVHLQANHLLENAIALTMVAAAFEGKWAKTLWKSAWPLLQSELDGQFLSDGMHYERSPMYQARLLYALSQAEAFLQHEAQAVARARLQSGARALHCMQHPDGDIALFNDSAFEIAHRSSSLLSFFEAQQLVQLPRQQGGWALPAAGYFGFRSEKLCLIADLGTFGPRHQIGHAHADFGSFELSVGGQRFITDTGVYHYLPGPQRQLDRSIAGHNTVEVESLQQIELWSAFRAARESRMERVLDQADEKALKVRGTLKSYAQGRRRYTHTRQWTCTETASLWQDRLQASCNAPFVSRLHLAPQVQVEWRDDQQRLCDSHGNTLSVSLPPDLTWQTASSPYHPLFHRELERPSLIGEGQTGTEARQLDYKLEVEQGSSSTWHTTCHGSASASSPSLV
ncbi:MAG: heparinase II/III family protein [Puniceicoccaceae bacterium 5H]|nr:MAG: heparinase II/III family protein [Puniceicoccaceae bacterium 5H]